MTEPQKNITSGEDVDMSRQPRVDGVLQPNRKRPKIACSVSSTLQDGVDVNCESAHSAGPPMVVKILLSQDALQQDQKLACSQGGKVETCGPDKVKFDRCLNIRRKKSNKRMFVSDHNRDILYDGCRLWLPNVEDNASSSMKTLKSDNIQMQDTCPLSQDSFCELFATSPSVSPTCSQQSSIQSSEIFLSQDSSTLKCDSELILDLLDGDDSILVELDVSGLASSNQTACKMSANQGPSQPDICYPMDVDVNTNFENINVNNNQTTSMNKLNSGSVMSNSHVMENQCHVGKNESEKLFYGLPPSVGSLIKKHKGIEQLYDWQKDCLNLPGVQKRENLIYSLPTSGGKTLVAEILMMKELLCHEKDALLILPFVSIVQEKVRDMSLFAVDLEFLVEEYAASKGTFPPRKRRKKKSLYIATIEKANGLVNCLIEENRLSEIGLVVVDELHMLGDGGRGATLEMCLAKILFCSSKTQIIGMSATLNNIEDLQQFLNADKYVNDFRPVELKEFIKIEDEIYEVKNDKTGRHEEIPLKRSRRVKHQSNDKRLKMNDPDHLTVLVQEVIPTYSCLLFCATKKNCQNVGELLANNLSGDLKKIKVKEKRELLHSLKSNADGLCPVLRRLIPYGIAYHHSGLTMDERKLIEDAYSQGILCLLTCTSTLAAGVNLPAKRVILRSPYVGISLMSRSQYKQMIGRAGRAGIDTSGESIMVLKMKDKDKAMEIVNAPMESCLSSLLHSDGLGLRSLLLSLIGLRVCKSMQDINLFTSKTLLAVQSNLQGNNTLLEKVHENIESLVNLKLVERWNTTEEGRATTRIDVTALGRAAFKGCVDVDRSPFIYEEIKRAQENLVLANDLHLLYLVTTPDMSADIRPNWMIYLKQVSSLNSVEQKACEFIGVSEGYLSRRAAGHSSKKSEQESSVEKRFYLTLMLYKIVKEETIWDIANTFELPRGFLQSLFTSSTSFAFCLVHFTKELPEFHNIRLLLETIVEKLSYTAVLELVPLMQIPGVKKNRARQLYTVGYRNLQAVAKADPETLIKEIEHLPRKQANLLVSAAKMLLLEKAEALQDEAAELIGT